MRRIPILLATLLAMGCAVDRRCEKLCASLRSVKPDEEGYLPRYAVFKAAGITETDLIPFIRTPSGGYTNLDCGVYFEFTARGLPAVPTEKTTKRILNNPYWTAPKLPNQLESVVVVDRRNREILRMESTARRLERADDEKKEAEPQR